MKPKTILIGLLIVAACVTVASAATPCDADICITTTTFCPSPGVTATIFPFNPSGMAEMPRVPMTFGGCVFINGEPAPAGTIVEVRGTNVRENHLILDTYCFGKGSFDPKVVAQGTPVMGGMQNIREGEMLYFFVNGEPAYVIVDGDWGSYMYYHSGHHRTIELRVGNDCSAICG